MTFGDKLAVEAFFDPDTWTISYLVLDTSTRRCALIDSVLDYDPKSGRTRTASADRLLARVQELDARVEWILETHVHADHLSAAAYLRNNSAPRSPSAAISPWSSRCSANSSMPAATSSATAASSTCCWGTTPNSASAP